MIFDRGRSLLLLDGLDEVTGEDGKNIAKEIKRFARTYPQVQIIVTCRTQNQESRFDRFDYVEVADFNESQVRAFAQHYLGFGVQASSEREPAIMRARELARKLGLEFDPQIDVDPELQEELEILRSKLPEIRAENSIYVQHWCQTNWQDLIEEIDNIKYRYQHLVRSWNFSEDNTSDSF